MSAWVPGSAPKHTGPDLPTVLSYTTVSGTPIVRPSGILKTSPILIIHFLFECGLRQPYWTSECSQLSSRPFLILVLRIPKYIHIIPLKVLWLPNPANPILIPDLSLGVHVVCLSIIRWLVTVASDSCLGALSRYQAWVLSHSQCSIK